MPNTIVWPGLEIALRVLAERKVYAGIAREKLSGPNQKLVAIQEALVVERGVVCGVWCGLFQRAKHGAEVPEGD